MKTEPTVFVSEDVYKYVVGSYLFLAPSALHSVNVRIGNIFRDMCCTLKRYA